MNSYDAELQTMINIPNLPVPALIPFFVVVVGVGFLSFHLLGFDQWATTFCGVECEVQATNG